MKDREAMELAGASDEDAKIISLKEAAARIGVGYVTALRLAREGKLKAFRINNMWRTSTVACDRFMAESFARQDERCRIHNEE